MSGRNEGVAGEGHENMLSVGAALWRRRFWILLPTLLALLGSIVFVTFAKPRYTGEARVLLENRETAYSRPNNETRGTDPAIDAEAVASQVQVMTSRDLGLKVVKDMKLANNPEFDPLVRGQGLLGKVLVTLGLANDPARLTPEDRALDSYFKRLLAFPQGKSRVISVEFQSEDPKLAAEVANRVVAEYLSRDESAKTTSSRTSSEWLDRAIEPLYKKVLAADAKVESFRASKGLFLGSGSSTITNQQLSELNTQLSSARAQQADLQARARLIREALRLGRVFETSEINNNELVRRLLEQRAGMKAQIALEERTLLPGHPRMRELQAQLNDLEGQIRAAAERAARALDNDSRVAGARVASMQGEIDNQKKTAALSNEDEVQLKALERDALALREQLNSYRTKFLDAAARSNDSAHPADARIISKAYPASEPTFPKKLPIILLATLGTFAVASTLVATSALMARANAAEAQLAPGTMDPYGYGPVPQPAPRAASVEPDFQEAVPVQREVQHEEVHHEDPRLEALRAQGQPAKPGLGLPFSFSRRRAVASPAVEASPANILPEQPPSASEPLYDAPSESLARELAMMDLTGHGRVVMVFALEPDPRLSLSTLRFGRRLARDAAAVVLDLTGQGANQPGGNLFSRLLAPGVKGLNAYLDHTAPLGDIIHRDSRTQLHVIPSGGAAFQRLAASSQRDQISGLIEALRRAYSHVVIDAGTVGGSGELFAHHADAIVLLSNRDEEDAFLTRAVEKFEGLRDAPVFVMGQDSMAQGAAEPGTTEPGAANRAAARAATSNVLAAFSRA